MALRISEITNYSKSFHHAIQYADIKICKIQQKIEITLNTYKHSKGKPTIYDLQCDGQLWAMTHKYIQARGSQGGSFFLHPDKKIISKKFFTTNLQQDIYALGLEGKNYNSHSFRIGRASSLALEGESSTTISLIGRWNSEAYKRYIKPTIIKI